MKPVIFCLEDFEVHRFVLESHLDRLLQDKAQVRYFRSLAQLKAWPENCQLLISDLNLSDSKAENTARFLLEYCRHTPVIVQSSEEEWPARLEQQACGRIQAVEKGGQGQKFTRAIQLFMTRFNLQISETQQGFKACP
ncbi:MAG TPA: response regulator [Limnobacter sp.]|nr:response regulator [Limnobacter sp.]